MPQNDDLVALLSRIPPDQLPEELRAMFYPNQQEQGVLEQEMALADKLRRPSDSGQHASPWGAALGGLSDAVGNIGGAYMQRKGLDAQRALGTSQQDDAVKRIKMMQQQTAQQQEDERQRALAEFLQRRGDAMGFNTGITNWGG